MNNNMRAIAQATDKLDNLIGALELNIPSKMHVDILKMILPEVRDNIRDLVIMETRENPWKTFDDDTDDDN